MVSSNNEINKNVFTMIKNQLLLQHIQKEIIPRNAKILVFEK